MGTKKKSAKKSAKRKVKSASKKPFNALSAIYMFEAEDGKDFRKISKKLAASLNI